MQLIDSLTLFIFRPRPRWPGAGRTASKDVDVRVGGEPTLRRSRLDLVVVVIYARTRSRPLGPKLDYKSLQHYFDVLYLDEDLRVVTRVSKMRKLG